MLMGWAMSVYKHPCVSYEMEDIPEEFQLKYINRLNLFNKTAFKTWVCQPSLAIHFLLTLGKKGVR